MKPVKIAVVSDIHLGHRNTSTRSIIENLELAFPDNQETAELDILFFAGDVFDERLSYPTEDVWEIETWVTMILRRCKKHDILVRVLEGTPRHDWGQSKVFTNMNQNADIGADLKYVKDLSIEYIERYGITVLYVPDELRGGPDKTLSQTKSLLKAKGLEQVDIAIMHGAFDFQIPGHSLDTKHDSAAYLALVKYLIAIGHIHTHSVFEHIYAQGSFDRLGHGQEEAKGHIRAIISDEGYQATFVENKGAKRYVTVNCVYHQSIQDSLEKIDQAVLALPVGSFVRIEAKHDNPIVTDLLQLVKRYPLFSWSSKVHKDGVILNDEDQDNSEEQYYSAVTITRENLPGLLLDRLLKLEVPSDVQLTAERLLKEVIDGL